MSKNVRIVVVGTPGSGKTAISLAVKKALEAQGLKANVISDGEDTPEVTAKMLELIDGDELDALVPSLDPIDIVEMRVRKGFQGMEKPEPTGRVIVLRGLPGAGKSTWLKKNAPLAEVCSADKFFEDADGTYNFDPKKLSEAHGYCMGRFHGLITNKAPLIAVDNTNLRARDFRWYCDLALDNGYKLEIVTLLVPTDVAASRCTHGVPKENYAGLAERLKNLLPADLRKYEVVEGSW